MEIEDSKYEGMVAAKAEADTKVTQLTSDVTAKDARIQTLEAQVVTLTEERDTAKAEAEAAKEVSRVAAMADERMSAFGTGFRSKLDKMETTAKAVKLQAGKLDDTEWEARVVELEELLSTKRDATLKANDAAEDGGKGDDTTAGLLFDRETVANSRVGHTEEVTAGEGGASGQVPSVERRQSVIGGLVRPRKKAAA